MTQTSQKIRLAPTPPSHCSSCFGAYPQRRHVDFGASFDGPVLPSGLEASGVNGVSIDDLIVCEDCLATAAREIGFGDVAALTKQIEQQAAHAEELTERLAGAIAYYNKLETAIAAKPEPKTSKRRAS